MKTAMNEIQVVSAERFNQLEHSLKKKEHMQVFA